MTGELDEPAMIEAFGTWLLTQHNRSDWIGDLARSARADRGFPRGGDPEAIRAHLNEKQADSDMLEAVDDAERDWRNRSA